MRRPLNGLIALGVALSTLASAQSAELLPNPQIDASGFAKDVAAAGALRATRRISEEEFIRMAKEPGTVVLDARSDRLFRLRHVKGAANLSFPEFTAETLARVIPSKGTRVLIYCNNNFVDAPASMPTKIARSALNLSTYVALYAYGYRNVYELGPAVNVRETKLEFGGSEIGSRATAAMAAPGMTRAAANAAPGMALSGT